MEVEDFTALKGCPWTDFWLGDGNADAAAAVEVAKKGETARFRGPANTAKGTPRYWDVQVSPVFGNDGRPVYLLSISRDITDEHNAIARLEENSKRERFLTEELEHRAKNIFSMIAAIARQTFRGEAYAAPLEVYNSRIAALATAHGAVNKTSWTNTPIHTVVEEALKSHLSGEGRFSIAGPELNLSPNQTVALTLAINELATNAAKYGALSTEDGRVEISWAASLNGASNFNFNWRERDGPPVVTPDKQGFGSRVIKELLANDFGGTVRLSYDPAGFSCELDSPFEKLPI